MKQFSYAGIKNKRYFPLLTHGTAMVSLHDLIGTEKQGFRRTGKGDIIAQHLPKTRMFCTIPEHMFLTGFLHTVKIIEWIGFAEAGFKLPEIRLLHLE